MAVRYTQAFLQNIGSGTLSAKFQLDAKGNPVTGHEEGTDFYPIDLSLRARDDAEVEQVTYLLDQATYWEPERVSKDKANNFTEEITSYGDFLVRVEVVTAKGKFKQQSLLSDMLDDGHGPNPPASIASAITMIRQN